MQKRIGAHLLDDGKCFFRVWAPLAQSMDVILFEPSHSVIPMAKSWNGYWTTVIEDVKDGARYLFQIDGKLQRPDPASHYQPTTVHEPSQVVSDNFPWGDQHWFGIPMSRYVLYELHVGTYTPEGTFEGVISHLDKLKKLGVTAIELMPINQFPGSRNWGYDGVYLFAIQNSYGGPQGFKKLVNAAHERGIAIVVDVVYNHLGPEGNYLRDFGPYFTTKYTVPWGEAINFDGEYSDEVRHFFFENMRYLIEDCHVDGLRLDATHFIMDTSAVHFLQELSSRTRMVGERVNRRVHLFAETDANDVRWVRSADMGGFGINAVWNDDFQHALVTVLPGADSEAYRGDYGDFRQLTKAYEEGYVYSGQYSPHRKRRHGNSSRDVHGKRLVVFMQNHDQVGNRPKGDRLCNQVHCETIKLAAAACILSPFVPLLFMGEEYAENAPFLYFVDHSDEKLIEKVRKGRREEFAHFLRGEEMPDPQDPGTFEKSRLNHRLAEEGMHKVIWDYYAELLRLRREIPSLASLTREGMILREYESERVLLLDRICGDDRSLAILCFSDHDVDIHLPVPAGKWTCVLDSSDLVWSGPGGRAFREVEGGRRSIKIRCNAQSALLYVRNEELVRE